MDKKLFRSYLLLITFTVLLVLVITKIDLLAGAAVVLLGLLKPFFIGFALAFVLNIPYEADSPRFEQIRSWSADAKAV